MLFIFLLHTFAIAAASLTSSTSLMGYPKQNWLQALGELFREATQDERQERLIQTSKRSQKPVIYPPGNQTSHPKSTADRFFVPNCDGARPFAVADLAYGTQHDVVKTQWG